MYGTGINRLSHFWGLHLYEHFSKKWAIFAFCKKALGMFYAKKLTLNI